jgi:hypothetical protein
MAPLFFAIGAIAAIWSAVKSQVLYRKLVDSFPPQFQDELTSRYAFSVFALSSSTPLPLQAEYMKCQYAGCGCFLCISLGIFFLGNVVLGSFVLLGFVFSAFSTFKSWKIYQENCNRTVNEQEQ